MTIIVEDGSDVPDANSYVSLDNARTYAVSRGFVLPSDDALATVNLMLAMDYLEAQSLRYQGEKTSADQSLQWPRKYVTVDRRAFPEDQIPKQLVTAQCWLACQSGTGVDLMPNYVGVGIKSEKLGPLETVFSDTVNPTGAAILPYADSLLKPLYGSNGFFLTSVRV